MGTIGPCEYGVTGRCQYMYTYICVVCIGLRLLLSRDTRLIFFSHFSHPVCEVPPMKLKNVIKIIMLTTRRESYVVKKKKNKMKKSVTWPSTSFTSLFTDLMFSSKGSPQSSRRSHIQYSAFEILQCIALTCHLSKNKNMYVYFFLYEYINGVKKIKRF